jgi:hydrogenase/urease accessory protein HupE
VNESEADHSYELMGSKNRMCGWLAALFISAASLAYAHDPGLSTAALRVFPDRLEAEVIFARADIEALVLLDLNRDGLVSAEELDRMRPQLEPLARAALSVVVDGDAVPVAESGFRLDDINNFHIVGVFQGQGAKTLTAESPFLEKLPRGHRQFISVLDDKDATLAEALLSAEQNVIELNIPKRPAAGSQPVSTGTFPDFFLMGVEHILTGYDHLLFLLALLIAISQFRATLLVITCFTLAHSATLALAAFDVVRISGRIVEPLIALTIIYVGIENLLSSGAPTGRWRLTLIFGMVHGLGFATELKEKLAGVTGAKIAVPLLSFNLGVELGQIAVAALVLPLILWMRSEPIFLRRTVPVCSALVVLAGTWWLVQRTLLA